jgi:P27 family predicted phage terminase small subunit
MPTGLSPWGRKLWKTVTDELDRLGLLTLPDGVAMQAAIRAADTANAADKTLNTLLRRCSSGKAADKDWYHLSMANNVSKKGWNQFKAFAVEFGMTPASRSRLTVETPAKGSARPADSVERVLCG